MYSRFLLAGVLSWPFMLSGPVHGQTLDDARVAIRARDFEVAAAIFENLARSGDHEAAYQLASMYRTGRGVEPDIGAATEWMLLAASAGDARAQYSMGQLILKADERQEGREKAREWFEKAARQGHNMAIKSLQELDHPADSVELEMAGQQGVGALNLAARHGDSEMVRSLLRTYPDESPGSSSERTALIEAIIGGHADIVAILLQNGANPNGVSNVDAVAGHMTPLHAAVRSESPDIVNLLLKAGADVEGKDEAGNSALIIASAAGDDIMVLTLLAAGAGID
jgi:hypothetical protein